MDEENRKRHAVQGEDGKKWRKDGSQDISPEDLFEKFLCKSDADKLKDQFKIDESLTFLDYSFLSKETKYVTKENRAPLVHGIHEWLQEEKVVVNYKVFNDPVHGSIQVHPLAVCIIDMPLFQRLRYLKQMGGVSHVYPGGTHTRFEHSIGVYHLAGKVVNSLKKNQPELNITAFEAMCVQIAGLCHDLGHGPFSHLFEKVVQNSGNKEWTHESQSVNIMEYLFKDPSIKEEFEKWGFQQNDVKFIISLVEAEEKDKGFLYEIVSNSESGMDVDKWDYLARDAYHLGFKSNFEHNRLIFHFKVLSDGKSERHIYVRDKEQFTVLTMYAARYALHKSVCKHPVTQGVEMMIEKALVSAADHLEFIGEKGAFRNMLESLNDLEAYTKVHDGIYHMILNHPRNVLKESKDLLERIESRDLWKCVGQLAPQDELSDASLELNEDITHSQALLEKLTKKLTKVEDLIEKLSKEGTSAEKLMKDLQTEITDAQVLMATREKTLTDAKNLLGKVSEELPKENGLTKELDKLSKELPEAGGFERELNDVVKRGKLLQRINSMKEKCEDHMRKGVPKTILDDLKKELNRKEVLDKVVTCAQVTTTLSTAYSSEFTAEWTSKDFGRKMENPLKDIKFFDKDGKVLEDEMKLLNAPNKYSFKAIRVYWKGHKAHLKGKQKQEDIKKVLEDWAGRNKFRVANGHE